MKSKKTIHWVNDYIFIYKEVSSYANIRVLKVTTSVNRRCA